MITQQHKTCDTHPVNIDWELTNTNGLPAVVCEQCVNKKGKRKGKAKFICWLSRKDLYKIQFGDDWEHKYNEHLINNQLAEQRAQRETFIGDVPGNYTAYTG